MVTRATVHCPHCGRVSILIYDVTVRICRDDPGRSNWRYTCPLCRNTEVAGAPPWVVTALRHHGARVERWSLPSELADPARANPEPLDPDGVIDLCRTLDELDWVDRLGGRR